MQHISKQSIVDVLCSDQNGVQIIVEMQVSKHPGFEKRAQFYAAKVYANQVLKPDDHHKGLAVYAKLKGVIFLAIADFTMFPSDAKWLSQHEVLDNVSCDHQLKDFHFIFMELPKFNKKIGQLTNLTEKWVYFFKHAEDSTLEEMEDLIGPDVIIKRAFQAIEQASWSEKELRSYEKVEKTYFDNLVVEQQKLADAEAKGEVKGEKNKAIAIAQKMILRENSIEEITEITELSRAEIETIQLEK